jgi:hypothetical protein
MWTIITQLGFANAIVDFTGALSPLLLGLMGLVALSAGMLVMLALGEQRTQITTPVTEPMPVDYQDVAYREAA